MVKISLDVYFYVGIENASNILWQESPLVNLWIYRTRQLPSSSFILVAKYQYVNNHFSTLWCKTQGRT